MNPFIGGCLCQKSGGAYGSPLMILHKDSFDCLEAELSTCITKSDRGSTVIRNFCKDCGSHIYSQISDFPEIVTVKAATLEDFNIFVPEYLAWTKSASPLCALPSGIPSFPENAPLGMLHLECCSD